ncbi:MAG: hypothetical protein A3K08_00485 [Candidatus Doudnabacteria bacterium RIFCSPLOWO2_01_41_7]|nr:MAG: hypothetical protein A3K08_00485 [Candidatus Doudnabacteria bacterium RIFCSPLOWO2_01_41_7]
MPDNDNDITLFAKTNFRNKEVAFGIRQDDRRRHMYIIGKTGMGKTTLIENMVIQDILAGKGVAFVDPHGDSVEKVLDYIPSNRVNDVVYLNPADSDFPIAFNPLESVDPKYKHLVASGLMGVFTKIWAGVWSARMEYILNNTILALLDSPGNTLLGIARMLVNKNYRKRIVDNIKDPVVKSFWVDEFANYNDKFRNEAIAPIQNKVGQFLSSAIIRNIVGQTKRSIDLRDIMDNQKIFLINLSKGRIGEDNSALLGAMIITKLQLAAMSRVDIPEEQRKDFYLYVDEFQNFATESFANILSEARKYRLNLIVAHQYIGQLVQDRNTVVRDAIFGNVGTLICFRVGADDAEFLEKEFDPTYLLNDLVNLTKFHIYLKLMINGVSSTPFSATTLAPISEATENRDKVIKVSRERYAVERSIVEEKINRWMGAEFHAEAAAVESGAMEQEDMQENFRYQERKITGTPQQIRESAPAAPRTDRIAPPVAERRPEERRRRPETNFQRRASDKPKKENPVWETVNKLTKEKLQDRLDDLGKSIEHSIQPAKPQEAPRKPVVVAPSPPKQPAPPAPAPQTQPEQHGTLKPGDKIQF